MRNVTTRKNHDANITTGTRKMNKKGAFGRDLATGFPKKGTFHSKTVPTHGFKGKLKANEEWGRSGY